MIDMPYKLGFLETQMYFTMTLSLLLTIVFMKHINPKADYEFYNNWENAWA